MDLDGRPTGARKSRAEVHANGDWHRSVHLWVYADGDLLFQKHAAGKDTFPGLFDVAVTGHLSSGEGLEAVVREAREELGITVALAQLGQLGRRWREHRSEGVLDREIQDVLFCRLHGSLSELTPSEAEVEGVLAVSLEQFDALISGTRDRVNAEFWEGGAASGVGRQVALHEFIADGDEYYRHALTQIRERLSGRTPSPFRLGATIPHTPRGR